MSTPLQTQRISIEPVGVETLEWLPRAREMYSRAEVERQTGSYQATIPAPIAAWNPDLDAATITDIEDATRQLISFDEYAWRAFGATNSVLGPMSAILLRTESASSSQIEQLTTSAEQLALAEIGEGDKLNALTVIGNVRAMEAALRLADEVNEYSILAMHEALLSHQIGLEHEAGSYRREQVWIGAGTAGPRLADFVAPVWDRVPGNIADLVLFIKRQNLPVLAQVAVAHAQFETIHPFVDGNGRTGRALAQSILRNKGLVASTAVPISAGLLVDTEGYFSALDAYRGGDAGPIIRAFAQASRIAATTGRELVQDLAEELEASRARLRGVRSDAATWNVLPTLIGQPIVNTKYLVANLRLGEMAALRALDTMTERGVLLESTGRNRNRVWQHQGILNALDRYASRIRRMSTGRS